MKLTVLEIGLFERDVALRMPFRFGAATLTCAPQAFVRVRVRLEDGREASGAAAEMLVPKWFDKDPQLSNEQNFDQLRASLGIAREAYLAGGANTAFGHWVDNYGPQIALCALRGLNGLVAGFGPALIDRAVLDAMCRALGITFFEAVRSNAARIAAPGWQADLEAFDLGGFLSGLRLQSLIGARHTVGLLDPLTAHDLGQPVDDGLPQTLEQVIGRYGNRWFKLKVSGDVPADLERLCAVAAVLDRSSEPYQATLDGNEQFESADAALRLWQRMQAEPRLKRLVSSIAYIEQPVRRSRALEDDVTALAEERAVIIDESDDSLEAFPRARRLGYTGVSSKTCKGLYKSILNRARCAMWNREEGEERFFMSGEDLTIQAGIALQQDLALVSLLGLTHVERNGHHYVNGMAGLPEDEQQGFLRAHPDLYERSDGAVRLKIRDCMVTVKSLACAGYASAAMPDWNAMREMDTP